MPPPLARGLLLLPLLLLLLLLLASLLLLLLLLSVSAWEDDVEVGVCALDDGLLLRSAAEGGWELLFDAFLLLAGSSEELRAPPPWRLCSDLSRRAPALVEDESFLSCG